MRFKFSHLSFCALLFLAAGCAHFERAAYVRSHSLDRFLADRPAAANIISQYPTFEQWLRTEWQRPVAGYRLTWREDSNSGKYIADNSQDEKNRLVSIRVSRDLSPADQVCSLAFEICNAQGRHRFDDLPQQARAGKISRAEFVEQIERAEYAAVLRLKKLLPVILPLPAEQIAATHYYRLVLETPEDFHQYELWTATIGEVHQRAHESYGRQYDELTRQKK